MSNVDEEGGEGDEEEEERYEEEKEQEEGEEHVWHFKDCGDVQGWAVKVCKSDRVEESWNVLGKEHMWPGW